MNYILFDYYVPFITEIKGLTFKIGIPDYAPSQNKCALLSVIKNPVSTQGKYGGNYIEGKIEDKDLREYLIEKYSALKK